MGRFYIANPPASKVESISIAVQPKAYSSPMHKINTEKTTSPKTTLEATYQSIRRNIVAGVHPQGTKLPIGALTKQYSVSAGTIRESLSRLISESLVDTHDQKGFSVSPMSLNSLREITELRILLEKEALRQSIRLGDEYWEQELVSASYLLARVEGESDLSSQGIIVVWEQRNRAFHTALIAAYPSSWHKMMIDMLYSQWVRYSYCAINSSKSPGQLNEEHTAIQEAALARDSDAAERLLEAHIRDTADHLLSSGLIPE
ncbi:MAG: transcriptional regulator [Gammaproteobacteria bacterium]|nr:MAG: transcriptional regulator [Gammaproteobacteria bacterium]